MQQPGILEINGCRRVEQFRDAADTRSGSAGLGFQKGNLRRRLLVIFIIDRSRLPTCALNHRSKQPTPKHATDLALHFLASAKLASQSRSGLDKVAAIPFVIFERFAAVGIAMAPAVIDRLFADRLTHGPLMPLS